MFRYKVVTWNLICCNISWLHGFIATFHLFHTVYRRIIVEEKVLGKGFINLILITFNSNVLFCWFCSIVLQSFQYLIYIYIFEHSVASISSVFSFLLQKWRNKIELYIESDRKFQIILKIKTHRFYFILRFSRLSSKIFREKRRFIYIYIYIFTINFQAKAQPVSFESCVNQTSLHYCTSFSTC